MRKVSSFLFLSLLLFSCTEKNQIETITSEEKSKPVSTSFSYIDHASSKKDKAEFDKGMWYRNDLDQVNLADPDLINGGDGKYYIYGTTDRTASLGFDCYDTADFSSFVLHKDIYKKEEGHWAESGSMFAPEVRYIGDKYYLYYSDLSLKTKRRSITVLTSSAPYGPFKDYVGEDYFGKKLDGRIKAIFSCIDENVGFDVLDQTIFTDDDGLSYMFWSVYQTGVMQYIQGALMLDPVTLDMSTCKTLLIPGSPSIEYKSSKNLIWEAYQSYRVAEGPYLIKSPVNNKYYLTYSVNHYPDRYYSVCYAESLSPLGEYKKPYDKNRYWTINDKMDSANKWSNILLGYAGGMKDSKTYSQWEGFVSGSAHHCFFKIGNQTMIGYHAHKNRKDSSNGRAFAFDYLYFDPETGRPFVKGPSYSLMPQMEAISGYRNIAPISKLIGENIINPHYLNDNYVAIHNNLDRKKEREAILNEGLSYIKIEFPKEYWIAGISIYNSSSYDNYLRKVSFISFGNGNVILDGSFREKEYVDDEKEFIRPCSSFTYQFEKIKARKVIIGFESDGSRRLNEIEIYGK